MGSPASKLLKRQDSEGTPSPDLLIKAYKIHFQRRSTNFNSNRSWVLFKNGTIVDTGSASEVKHETIDELAAFAKRYLKSQCRCTIASTPVADFSASYDAKMGGWLICFQDERVQAFVPADKPSSKSNDYETSGTPVDFTKDFASKMSHNQEMTFGLVGRMLRHKDARELIVIYVHKPISKLSLASGSNTTSQT